MISILRVRREWCAFSISLFKIWLRVIREKWPFNVPMNSYRSRKWTHAPGREYARVWEENDADTRVHVTQAPCNAFLFIIIIIVLFFFSKNEFSRRWESVDVRSFRTEINIANALLFPCWFEKQGNMKIYISGYYFTITCMTYFKIIFYFIRSSNSNNNNNIYSILIRSLLFTVILHKPCTSHNWKSSYCRNTKYKRSSCS